jgi:L-methionine (R)-S-oxide reductase
MTVRARPAGKDDRRPLGCAERPGRGIFAPAADAMHTSISLDGLAKRDAYREIRRQLSGLFEGEPSALANSANLSSLLYHSLPRLNWAGFYFLRGGELVLGPFQGRVACVRIAMGRGVCGTAARERRAVIVPDVSKFPGHIVCDSASRSEIVIPLVRGERLLGVLDLDSPDLGRFDEEDREGLSGAAEVLLRASDFSGLAD